MSQTTANQVKPGSLRETEFLALTLRGQAFPRGSTGASSPALVRSSELESHPSPLAEPILAQILFLGAFP